MTLETKPVRKPKTQMKALWWTKLVIGDKIKKGETIWDKVTDDTDLIPLDELEKRFSKSAAAAKKAPKEDNGEKKEEKLKEIRILTDPSIVVGREASLKNLPPAQEMARAVEELDEQTIDLEILRILRENACPTPPQMKELVDARKANPGVPLALPEQFMWVIGNLPAYQQRLDCWDFVRAYVDRYNSYSEALSQFDQMMEAILDSTQLPPMLGLVLAVGNYLNGGTNRGQADGFDIETLGKLDSIKDAEGQDIRQFLVAQWLNNFTDKAAELIEELMPVLININRRLAKDGDGVEKCAKACRYSIEDFDSCVVALQAECTERHETMQMVLQYFEDPADQFKLRMPGLFIEAKEQIEKLVALKDAAKDKFAKILVYFKVSGMKSGDFCMLFDNFLCPGDLIVVKPDKTKKEILIPGFCQNKPCTLEDFLVLWNFKDVDEAIKEKAKKGKRGAGGKKRGERRRLLGNRRESVADGGRRASASEE